MSKIILLGGLAASYWAYSTGRLDSLVSMVTGAGDGLELGSIGRGIGGALSGIAKEKPVTANVDHHKAEIDLSLTQTAQMSKEEKILRDHWADVQPWARSNVKWAASMMWQESRGNTQAVSPAGAAGLLQVMKGTQGDLVRWGWNKYSATADLHQPNIGIYFGTAYMQYLSRKNSEKEWIAKAYNAGPAGQRSDGTWPRETNGYIDAIKTKFATL